MSSIIRIPIAKRIEMQKLALAERKAEYTALWDAWKVVESKAQPIAALAGVFLAGIFAYASQAATGATTIERIWLFMIAALLVASTIFAVRAIWIIDVDSPYVSVTGNNEIDDILLAADNEIELDERQERLIQSEVRRWTRACVSGRAALEVKRNWLSSCLFALACAAGACIPLVLHMLFLRVIEKQTC